MTRVLCLRKPALGSLWRRLQDYPFNALENQLAGQTAPQPRSLVRPPVHVARDAPTAAAIAYNAGMAAASMRELASAAAGGEAERGLYSSDPWAWSREQVAAMRRRDLGAVDWENVIEEIGDVAGRDERAWVSFCRSVISHLLKIHHSPKSPDLNHWRKEIQDWRGDMHEVLVDNPSMASKLPDLLPKAWRRGRAIAVRRLAEGGSPENAVHERRLQRAWESRLPAERPYHVEDIASYDPFDKDAEPNPDLWPAPVAQILNDELGTDYPVRYREPERSDGRTR